MCVIKIYPTNKFFYDNKKDLSNDFCNHKWNYCILIA